MKSAETIEEFQLVVNNLKKVIDEAMCTTTERDYSQANVNLTTAFRAVQYNVMTLANATRRKLDSHHVDIRYGRVDVKKPEADKATEKEKPAKKRSKKGK